LPPPQASPRPDASLSNAPLRPSGQLPSVLWCADVAALSEALTDMGDPRLCCPEGVLPRQLHSWDCGYANVAALLRTLEQRGVLPAEGAAAAGGRLTAIQQLVEAGWADGLDARSAADYGGRLLGRAGRSGWLGAPEAFVLLLRLRLRAFVVEVVDRTGAGRAVHAVAAAYFASADEGGAGAGAAKRTRAERWCTAHPPLYLQRDGHSQTILGVLTAPDCVLVRDPQDPPARVRCVRPAQLDGRQYQLVGVCAGRLGEDELREHRGEDPIPAACWKDGKWTYDPSCEMRFG
jgi:hypothetical protein